MERLAALSVDLDEVRCYAAIHGLEEAFEGEAARAIYAHAVPRFAALFGDLGVPATFFVIGEDLDASVVGAEAAEANAEALRALHAAGHEIANHSHHHLYDLTRRDPATWRAEVEGGVRLIEEAVGEAPVGFRAPGYTIHDGLFEALEELGVRYDSSVFPCPPYYGAKALALGLYRAAAAVGRGRPSSSILDDPRVLRSPADPYRVGRPYWTRGAGLVELPIAVTRGLRLPFIGTSVALAGERGAARLAAMTAGRPFVNLELHGIDLSDAEADGLTALRPHQPDLRKTAAEKEVALRSAVRRLRAAGHRFVTLRDAAAAFA
ncbi:MAG: polysaccharide deacetylase family protein [Myxococcota bacterium]